MFLLEIGAAIIILFVVVWLTILIFSDADVSLIIRTKYGNQPESLAGKVVWITGASSGIGEYYSYCLAEAGCKLVLSARREGELQRVKKACLSAAKSKLKEEDILVLPLDLTEFVTHDKKVQQVLEYFSKVDILINNAGKSQKATWMEVELDVDREMFEVNVLGPISLTQALLPHMIQRRQGHIVAVSSVAGKFGVSNMRSYSGAKHALQGYFDSLRVELSPHNIDVTLICPGPVVSNVLLNASTGKMGEVLGESMPQTNTRMTSERCAYLSCVAIANRQYETWLSRQPILLFVYLMQFAPSLGKWLMCKVGSKQVDAMRKGS